MDGGRIVGLSESLVRFARAPLSDITRFRLGTISNRSIPPDFYVIRSGRGDRAIFFAPKNGDPILLFVGNHDEYEFYLHNKLHDDVERILRKRRKP